MSPLDGEAVDLRGDWRGIDNCDTGGIAGVCNHLMTRWIDPVPSGGKQHKRHTDGDWGQKQTTDCSLVAADADIFIQLAQLTVIKENETLRLVCTGRRRGGRKTERRNSSVTFFWSTGEQRFIQTHADTYSNTQLRHFKYLRWTDASFPALLYLMHIKYHFPEKNPSMSCLSWPQRDLILITVCWLLPKIGFYHW